MPVETIDQPAVFDPVWSRLSLRYWLLRVLNPYGTHSDK